MPQKQMNIAAPHAPQGPQLTGEDPAKGAPSPGRGRYAPACPSRGWLPLLLAVAMAGCGVSTIEAPDANVEASRAKRPRDPSPTPPPEPTGTGSVAWQVALAGSYSLVRPAVGPDGTIYAVDVNGSLTAVAPDGSLRWRMAGAGGKGLAVGADGTIYTADEGAVRAFDPGGSLRWTFVQDPRAFVMLGLGVGPDGNLYGVATHGLGVFSLTPEGALRWAVPEPYDRPFVGYAELTFGPNGGGHQLAFYANAHIRAVDLDGDPVFTLARGDQPVLDRRDGTLHVGDAAYRPDGSLLWSFGFSVGARPEVGPDGTHYFVLLQSAVYALDTSGKERWHLASSDWLQEPSIDPSGAILLFGANDAATFGGVVVAVSTGGRHLWRLPLPAVNGFNQMVDTRAAFSADASTAYLVTRSDVARLTAVALR